MKEVLISGKASFKIEVPYRLIENGKKTKKPLIIYLHGFNQNIEQFSSKVSGMLQLQAYHLFIQGPYPLYERDRKKKVSDWGRAWYLYDGEQDQFIKSLELSSEFIQEITDKIIEHIDVSRLAVFGYSMGGYQAGYFALSRWKHVNELAVVGGRIKTEVFRDRYREYKHLNILALHGSRDKKVAKESQKESCKELSEWGANVTFRQVDAAHSLTGEYIPKVVKWFTELGYQQA